MSRAKIHKSPSEKLPAELGFWMLAEWEPHEATWLAWPHQKSDWPGKFAPIPWVYAEIVRHLSHFEAVRILVRSRAEERSAREVLQKSGAALAAVEFFCVPTDRCWIRDFGPVFLRKGRDEIAATHWGFNGWAKYRNWRRDAAAVTLLARTWSIPVWQPCHKNRRVVLESGSIEVNGRGTLLATEECLLSDKQARNPGFTKHDLEKIFHGYLGITQVHWLGRGIAGDDTHGHVDDVARFTDANTIAAVVEESRFDENYEPLQENLARLRSMRNLDGKSFRVVTLPMPAPIAFAGQRLPASYANFYIANRLVLVPTFNDPKDRIALNTLAGLFPARKVVGIACRDLVLGLGTLHCATQQQPEGNQRSV